MTDSEERGEEKKFTSTMLHIPVWAVLLLSVALVFIFFILLAPISKDRALYKQVGLTATRRWIDAAGTQTISVLNEQRTATQAAKATATPTPTTTPPPTPTPTQTPELKIGSTQISPVDNMTVLFVPVGSFLMGYKGGAPQNRPIHEVYLDNYWIDQTEISNGMYAQCVKAGKCSEPVSKKSTVHIDYYGNPDFDDFPVIHVSWFQANDYCKWVGRDLPTEAQWEKAARGDDGRLYPWGDTMDKSRGNFSPLKDDYVNVESFPAGASPYGALQMSGNAFEWVADWYDKIYYQIPGEWMNPTGPIQGDMHIVRGGFYRTEYYYRYEEGESPWWNIPEQFSKYVTIHFQSGYRMFLKPDGVSSLISFRCAASVP